MSIPLSVLDVVPVTSDSTPAEGLRHVAALAREAERSGYVRLWYAEHHAMGAIASSSPEVLIAHAAAATERIRLGSGGVMLPNHAPLRIAEAYRTLAALYPDRIDLGIGRAAGTDPLTARALQASAPQRFPQQLVELLAFGGQRALSEDHPFRHIEAVPAGVTLPPIWMLGSSGGSARLAGQLGLGYAFAQHFSPTPAGPALRAYREAFEPSAAFPEPHIILALAIVCAEDEATARRLAEPMKLTWLRLRTGQLGPLPTPEEALAHRWTPAERAAIAPLADLQIVGDPAQCARQVLARAEAAGADEVMVSMMIHDPAARLRGHTMLAEAIGAV